MNIQARETLSKENKNRNATNVNKRSKSMAIHFRSIKAFQVVNERANVVLSEEELSRKQELDESIRKFVQFYDQIIQTERERERACTFRSFQSFSRDSLSNT